MSAAKVDGNMPIQLNVKLGVAQIYLQALWTAPALLPYNQMQEIINDIQTQIQGQLDLHSAAQKAIEPDKQVQ